MHFLSGCHPYLLLQFQLLPHVHAQGVKQSVLSVIICHLSAQKSPDFDILTSKQSVSTVENSKKNLPVFASNRNTRLTGTTNRASPAGQPPCEGAGRQTKIVCYLLATPINHTYMYSYPCAFCPCAHTVSVGNPGKGH